MAKENFNKKEISREDIELMYERGKEDYLKIMKTLESFRLIKRKTQE